MDAASIRMPAVRSRDGRVTLRWLGRKVGVVARLQVLRKRSIERRGLGFGSLFQQDQVRISPLLAGPVDIARVFFS